MNETLPILDLDHPGANDQEYRKRREKIAAAAIKFHKNKENKIPLVPYISKEDKLWQSISKKLHHLHQNWASDIYLTACNSLNIPDKKVPSLRRLNAQLREHGFKLEPINGLISPREFFKKLGQNTMLCTQYIRHHSCPEFTPEPDIIHEVRGHVPMFTNPKIRKINQLIGKAAIWVNDAQLLQLERLYWYTLEYGLIEENGQIKALGAGLLGGISELTNAFKANADIKPFNTQELINTDYNYSFKQPLFFVIPSLDFLITETRLLISGFKKNK
jgi:phenylalanine-4-hydroxylase